MTSYKSKMENNFITIAKTSFVTLSIVWWSNTTYLGLPNGSFPQD